MHRDGNAHALPHFQHAALVTRNLHPSYRLRADCKSPAQVSTGISPISSSGHVRTAKSCHAAPFPFAVSTQTLSQKNNIKIGASIQPHLSCSLVELIYHWLYCAPQSSLFMLWQNKRQRSREVLRTVFVCHRVPFLIPQAPAMPGGAACGGGGRRKARLPRFFPAALKVAWGDGLREGLCDSLHPGHPLATEPAVDSSCARGEETTADYLQSSFMEEGGLATLNKHEGSRPLLRDELVLGVAESVIRQISFGLKAAFKPPPPSPHPHTHTYNGI